MELSGSLFVGVFVGLGIGICMLLARIAIALEDIANTLNEDEGDAKDND